jgi:molybdopterin/thiamine biosynthesis adenylyltransferase
MVIHDKKIVELVAEQTQYFLEDAPIEKKVDVLKRIQKRQEEIDEK